MSSTTAHKTRKSPPPGAIEIPSLPTDAMPPRRVGGGGPVHSGGSRGRRGASWLPWVLGVLMLGVGIWGFVTIRPVVVKTEPAAASLRLTGGQAWRSGGTWYLTAGDWQIAAELAGYKPLAEDFVVSRTGVNEFFFEFERLPGKLSVTATDKVSGQAIPDFRYRVNEEDGHADLAIAPGEATVMVAHPDYLPATVTVEIEGLDKRQTVMVELVPRRGVIAVRKILPEVAVWIAGDQRGLGPGEWSYEPGEYKVELRRSGYRGWERTVTVKSGERVEIDDAKLTELPGTVRFTSTPPGAQVLLDDAVAGMTPFSRELTPGVYAVRAVLAGYHPSEQLLELAPAEQAELNFELKAVTGKLTVVSPEGTEIRVDGKVWEAGWPADLPVGPHLVEARFGELPAVARTVIIRQDREATLTFTPPAPETTAPEPESTPVTKLSVTTELGIDTVVVRVPKEPFQIGSPRGEPNRRANEAQRTVRLTRDFEMSTTEITNGQYAKFDGAHQSGTDLSGAAQPVLGITWDQAAKYCNYLSEQDGLPLAYQEVAGKMKAVWPLTEGWRLPTEAEWELAARLGAPPNSPYPWGPALPPGSLVANLADQSYAGNGKLEKYDDKHALTAPVKTFAANALGLYDLAGNVAEWCHDYYSLSSGDPTRITVDPAGPERGLHHIVKGSSYRHYQPEKLRLALRDYSSSTRDDIGFRIVRFVPLENK